MRNKPVVGATALIILLSFGNSLAQSFPIGRKLQQLLDALQNQQGFVHASIGMCILNASTGTPVFDYHSEMGLAPASCLKTVTAITALNLLTDTFRFTTSLLAEGSISHHQLNGNLLISGSGDPTLGSWRYENTHVQAVLDTFTSYVRNAGIHSLKGNVLSANTPFTSQSIPDGWIWQDIGNYYGAGGNSLVFRENQYDIHILPGKAAGDKPTIERTVPDHLKLHFVNELSTGVKGSGDQTYIYFKPASKRIYLRGTAPLGMTDFTVSGSLPHPQQLFVSLFKETLRKSGIHLVPNPEIHEFQDIHSRPSHSVVLGTYLSPTLDSICYWMLKRSINLYAEQLLKAIAIRQTGIGSTDSGVVAVTTYWQYRGIDPSSLNIVDGSGLSPEDRITPKTLAHILFSAQREPWFDHFYQDLPVIHDIHMKSGYIKGVRSYAGWVDGRSGNKYVFAFIINNIYGDTQESMFSMFKILDFLRSY